MSQNNKAVFWISDTSHAWGRLTNAAQAYFLECIISVLDERFLHVQIDCDNLLATVSNTICCVFQCWSKRENKVISQEKESIQSDLSKRQQKKFLKHTL
jgi:hypothetical protein